MREIIRHYYDIFNSGDREALLALLAEDVVHEINEACQNSGLGECCGA